MENSAVTSSAINPTRQASPACLKDNGRQDSQGMDVGQWSLLIDQEQAMFTVSAVVGLTRSVYQAEITIHVSFMYADMTPDLKRSIKSEYLR